VEPANPFADTFIQLPVAQPLTALEIALRDRFVVEYLKDYDQIRACLRLGYSLPYAKEYGARFMSESYVQSKLVEIETKPEQLDSEVEKKRIRAALWREANNFGLGSSQSARVAALAKLSAFEGMDAPSRSKQELTGADGEPLGGGVFVVPGLMTTDQWETEAERQQAELTRPDVIVPVLTQVA
jgi:hypothetical protein